MDGRTDEWTLPSAFLEAELSEKSRKLSVCEFPSTVKSRKFSLAKLKCYTVHIS